MPVAIFLPSRGITLVVVAVLDAPVLADSFGGTGLFLDKEAGEKDTEMAFDGLRFFLLAPFPQHCHCRTCPGKSC